MAFQIWGEWPEIVDVLIKLAPAVSIVGGIFAARITFRNNRQLNSETIAKNHYREALEQLLRNTDIAYRGVTAEGFAELKRDAPAYRRYRMLSTMVSFALQELYLAMDLRQDRHWEQTVRVFLSMFRHYLLSDTDFPDYLQRCLDPRFRAFVMDAAKNFEHVTAKMSISENPAH